MGYVKCQFDQCKQWFLFDEELEVHHVLNQYCYIHGGKETSMMPMRVPQRRCIYLDATGVQCDSWFDASPGDKLCPAHREVASPGSRNGESEDQRFKYIDLVNDSRNYCYHFLDGTSQKQSNVLVFEFKDDEDGTVLDKIDHHLAFLESVIADVKARHVGARQVKIEKIEKLSEEERKKLREIKISRAVSGEKKEKKESKSKWQSKLEDLGASLTMDPDEIIAKFKKMRGETSENIG